MQRLPMQRLRSAAPVFAVFALLALAATTVYAQVWTGRGRLQGQITDQDGNPLAGVKVTITLDGEEGMGPEPAVTNEKGRYSFGGLGQGQWKVVVEAEGFVPREGMVAVNQFGTASKVNMDLRPIPKEVAQEAAAKEAVNKLEEGNQLLEAGKFADARAAYAEAMDGLEEANHPPILRGIARAWYQEGDVDKAIATLEQALEMDTESVDTLRLIVNLMVASGREADAEAYIARLPQGETLDPNSLLNLGIKAFNEGDIDKATGYFDRVVQENPNLADAYYYRGLGAMNKGDNASAITDFEKLLEIDPGHANASEAEQFLEYLKGQ